MTSTYDALLFMRSGDLQSLETLSNQETIYWLTHSCGGFLLAAWSSHNYVNATEYLKSKNILALSTQYTDTAFTELAENPTITAQHILDVFNYFKKYMIARKNYPSSSILSALAKKDVKDVFLFYLSSLDGSKNQTDKCSIGNLAEVICEYLGVEYFLRFKYPTGQRIILSNDTEICITMYTLITGKRADETYRLFAAHGKSLWDSDSVKRQMLRHSELTVAQDYMNLNPTDCSNIIRTKLEGQAFVNYSPSALKFLLQANCFTESLFTYYSWIYYLSNNLECTRILKEYMKIPFRSVDYTKCKSFISFITVEGIDNLPNMTCDQCVYESLLMGSRSKFLAPREFTKLISLIKRVFPGHELRPDQIYELLTNMFGCCKKEDIKELYMIFKANYSLEKVPHQKLRTILAAMFSSYTWCFDTAIDLAQICCPLNTEYYNLIEPKEFFGAVMINPLGAELMIVLRLIDPRIIMGYPGSQSELVRAVNSENLGAVEFLLKYREFQFIMDDPAMSYRPHSAMSRLMGTLLASTCIC